MVSPNMIRPIKTNQEMCQVFSLPDEEQYNAHLEELNKSLNEGVVDINTPINELPNPPSTEDLGIYKTKKLTLLHAASIDALTYIVRRLISFDQLDINRKDGNNLTALDVVKMRIKLNNYESVDPEKEKKLKEIYDLLVSKQGDNVKG